ncbi:MAG: hypothetical protein AB1938_08310 [Myxococcota bacterium]
MVNTLKKLMGLLALVSVCILSVPAEAKPRCRTDEDCAGDRVCQAGRCVVDDEGELDRSASPNWTPGPQLATVCQTPVGTCWMVAPELKGNPCTCYFTTVFGTSWATGIAR